MKCKEWNDVGVWDSPVEEGCLYISGGTTDVGYGEGISTDETWV